MTVHFVLRSPYAGPSGIYHVAFPEQNSVLEWFQHHWAYLVYHDGDPAPGEGEVVPVPWSSLRRSGFDARLRQILGCDVYGFPTLFANAADNDLASPAANEVLGEILQEYLPAEGEILFTDNSLAVLTDDDGTQIAYFLFDDSYLAENGGQAAYLLQQEWRLPTEVSHTGATSTVRTRLLKSAGRGQGTTYLVFVANYGSLNLDDLPGGYCLSGVRLPDLVHYLARSRPQGNWPLELRLLRSQILLPAGNSGAEEKDLLGGLLESPRDPLPWRIYGDWLQEQGQREPGLVLLERALRAVSQLPVAAIGDSIAWSDFGWGPVSRSREELQALLPRLRSSGGADPERTLVQVAEHVAQMNLHTARFAEIDCYHQWFLFDDLWVAAHVDLARSLLLYARQWNVLAVG